MARWLIHLQMPSNTLKHSACALDLPACFLAALLHNYQNPYNEGSGPSISYPQGTKLSPQALHTDESVFTLYAGYHSSHILTHACISTDA